jgi:hypothetical protein
VKKYYLTAKSKRGLGPDMRYTGIKFSDHGAAVGFKLWWSALKTLQRLKADYPILAGYNLGIVGPNGRTMINPKVRKARRKNPETRADLSAAAQRLQEFSGHEASEVLKIKEPTFKKGLVIGQLHGLLYGTVRDGRSENYIHRFRKSSRPLLAASSDGRTLRIVGGRFQFTEAGIEDR